MVEHIVSFSGGKDSTAMLFMMLERNMRIDRIINIDTTKEFPQMYKHIAEVQKRIPIQIEIVKLDFDYLFGKHVKTRGTRKGEVGYGWPDFQNRWCTSRKTQLFAKAAGASSSLIEYHGIAADELKRLQSKQAIGRNIKYPLAEWGVTEKDALSFCYSLGFDWGGLYDEGRSRVSCYCCPLQRMGELRLTYHNHPQLWESIQHMDKLSKRRFQPRYTLEALTCKFQEEESNGQFTKGAARPSCNGGRVLQGYGTASQPRI